MTRDSGMQCTHKQHAGRQVKLNISAKLDGMYDEEKTPSKDGDVYE